MGLFKSKDERRVEREMAIRKGVRAIEKSIAEQGRFSEGFIKQAQQARKIGDEQQYQFIRNSLKKTATMIFQERRASQRTISTPSTAISVSRKALCLITEN